MERLKMQSPSLIKENIEKIGALFPQCLTEKEDENGSIVKAVDFDILRDLLSDTPIVEDDDSRYMMTWPGKRAARQLAYRSTTKTLRPCREDSVNFDTTENLYIEGDNLEVLKCLRETYLGKIKMIYIDPPYNTGKDFIYKDNYAMSSDQYKELTDEYDEMGNRLVRNPTTYGKYHTSWLNFIYPRLLISRDLLTEDGAIFISIDDNEQVNLKKICDEIFGEQNCIGPIIQNKLNSKNDTLNIQKNHEYILVYRKSKIYNSDGKIVPTLKHIDKKELFLKNGEYYYISDPITTRGDGGTLNERAKLGYTVYYNPASGDFLGVNDYNIELAKSSNDRDAIYSDDNDLISKGYIPIRPPEVRGNLGAWTWELKKFNAEKQNIVIKKSKKSYSVCKKVIIDPKNVRHDDVTGKPVTLIEKNSKSILNYSTNEGTSALNKLMGVQNLFNTPKNVELIKYLIDLISSDDCTILDFFSGSATTAQSIMELNTDGEKNIKYILVQLPENLDEQLENSDESSKKTLINSINFLDTLDKPHLLTELAKERIRRAGKQIVDKTGNDVDIGFRVLKLDSSNVKDVYYTPSETKQHDLDGYINNIKEDRTSEDLLFQVLLEFGIPLSLPISTKTIQGLTVFNVAENSLSACFDKGVTEDVIKEMAKEKPLYAAFRDSSYSLDQTKINVEQIFKQLSPETRLYAV